MSVEGIKVQVRGILAQVNDKIAQAERKLASGSAEERAIPAGQLGFLKSRKDELEARMRELDEVPDNVVLTVIEWIKEDWMLLMERLEDWIGDVD
jgi:hypothetical protein